MDLFGILFLVVVVIAFFAFIFFLVKSARGWGAWHSIFLTIMFLQSIAFLMASAGVLSRRGGWVRLYDSFTKKVETSSADGKKLRYGNLESPELDPTSLLTLQSRVARLVAERGRSWSGSERVTASATEVVVKLGTAKPAAAAPADAPPADAANPPANPAAAPASGSGLEVSTVVYAFGEGQAPSGLQLPMYYLGQWTVSANDNGQVKLLPVLVTEQQAAMASDAQGAIWTLYELMPLDSHEAFAQAGSTPDDEQLFGFIDPTNLETLFQNVPADQQELIRSSYERDGKKATDNDQENIWVQVKFRKDYQVDVDNPRNQDATEGGYFDFEGKALDSRLKRMRVLAGEENQDPASKNVNFKKDDVVLMELEAVKALRLLEGEDEGRVADAVNRYYIRPMNDYAASFVVIERRMFEVLRRTEVLKLEGDLLEKASALTDALTQKAQVEFANLKSERVQYEKELAVINAEAERLDKELKDTRTKLSELFRTNQALYKELVAQHKAMQEKAGPGLAATK